MSFRTQQLLRVAISVCNGYCSTASNALGGSTGAFIAQNTFQSSAVFLVPGLQRGFAPLASLAQLQRGLHTGLPPAAAADSSEPGINPLQQAPPPLAARSLLDPSGPDNEAPLRARAIKRNIAISPRKLNMFAKVVRRLALEDALIQCEISCKKSAGILQRLIKEAKTNAVNNHGLDEDKLVVDEVHVGRGTHLKRTSVHGRGRSGVRLRYRSHLTVILAEKEGVKRRTRVAPMMAERYWDTQDRKLQRGRQRAAEAVAAAAAAAAAAGGRGQRQMQAGN